MTKTYSAMHAAMSKEWRCKGGPSTAYSGSRMTYGGARRTATATCAADGRMSRTQSSIFAAFTLPATTSSSFFTPKSVYSPRYATAALKRASCYLTDVGLGRPSPSTLTMYATSLTHSVSDYDYCFGATLSGFVAIPSPSRCAATTRAFSRAANSAANSG